MEMGKRDIIRVAIVGIAIVLAVLLATGLVRADNYAPTPGWAPLTPILLPENPAIAVPLDGSEVSINGTTVIATEDQQEFTVEGVNIVSAPMVDAFPSNDGTKLQPGGGAEHQESIDIPADMPHFDYTSMMGTPLKKQ